MFNFIFNEKFIKKLSNSISETISQRFTKIDLKLNDLDKKINLVDQKMNELNIRLTNKELKDKTEYGQLVYKVNSLRETLIGPTKKRPEKSSH